MDKLGAWLGRSAIAKGIVQGVLLGLAVLVIVEAGTQGVAWLSAPAPVTVTAQAIDTPLAQVQRAVADFSGVRNADPSPAVRHLANWIADARDASGNAYVIIDKKDAKVYIFDGGSRLTAASPVLLGGAVGDDTVPGIGERPLELVLPAERTTPAGRFVSERGRNTRGEDVVWIDYDAGVSMHRVITTDPAERRLERLATATSDDNRISYGCINVVADLYESHLRPLFANRGAIVYVLPETKSVEAVFGSHDVTLAGSDRVGG